MNQPNPPTGEPVKPVLPSIVRTFIPMLVGFVGTLLIRRFGVTIDNDTVTALVTGAVGFLWYLLVRLLELVRPKLGWLLGYAAQPTTYRKA